MKNKPLVSILIPCYNSESLIESCFKSILLTKYPTYEIIAVDDGSKDKTATLLKQLEKKNKMIKVIQNSKNMGPSFTRNVAIKEARGKYIAFLETDTEVDKGWLDPLVSAMEKNKELGAVQSLILDITKKDIISSSGIYLDPHTFWVHADDIGLPLNMFDKTKKQYILTGAVGSLFRKDIIDKIGGFDEKIIHNIDDLDFSFRVYLSGYTIALVPESKIYNWTMKPASIREQLTPGVTSEFYSQKTFRIFLKNYQVSSLIRYTPWLFLVFSLRVLTNLTKGNKAPFLGYIKAWIWNMKNFNNALEERRKIQKLRKISDREIFSKIGVKGNIIDIHFRIIKPTVLRAKLNLES